jgi:UDP-N-acetylmuramate--alanine ligase
MHIFFSGIGGTGIGPLALIAHQAGFTVSGSDKQMSSYIEYLQGHGVLDITIGQTAELIAAVHAANPIDWLVYSSALPKENPQHPELVFARDHDIKNSKRDEFLNYLLMQKDLKLLAVSGTHGKTTTTAMLIWLFKQLGEPASYSVGAKLSFGDMGHFDPASKYFLYECDEYDRNFLSFSPHLALISGIDWDHADVYPTRESYYQAFGDFIEKSERTIIWQADAERLGLQASQKVMVIPEDTPLLADITLPGLVNRRDACVVLWAMQAGTNKPMSELTPLINSFPGVTRRFEAITPGLYTDYAHTPKKIEGALQMAHEAAGENVVVVYEGLHNTRQHFIKDDLAHLFDSVKKLYVVPSYLAREDPNLKLLQPSDIIALTSRPEKATPSTLDDDLKSAIQLHLDAGDLVLCLSAGGGGSLDEWLRQEFK